MELELTSSTQLPQKADGSEVPHSPRLLGPLTGKALTVYSMEHQHAYQRKATPEPSYTTPQTHAITGNRQNFPTKC